MSISAVGVGNVNAVNNRREQLKQKRNLSMLLGASGLGMLGLSQPVKNNVAGLALITFGFQRVEWIKQAAKSKYWNLKGGFISAFFILYHLTNLSA